MICTDFTDLNVSHLSSSIMSSLFEQLLLPAAPEPAHVKQAAETSHLLELSAYTGYLATSGSLRCHCIRQMHAYTQLHYPEKVSMVIKNAEIMRDFTFGSLFTGTRAYVKALKAACCCFCSMCCLPCRCCSSLASRWLMQLLGWICSILSTAALLDSVSNG